MSQGNRSVMEFFVLEGILELCGDNADTILLIYGAIVEITESFEEKLPIAEKK